MVAENIRLNMNVYAFGQDSHLIFCGMTEASTLTYLVGCFEDVRGITVDQEGGDDDGYPLLSARE